MKSFLLGSILLAVSACGGAADSSKNSAKDASQGSTEKRVDETPVNLTDSGTCFVLRIAVSRTFNPSAADDPSMMQDVRVQAFKHLDAKTPNSQASCRLDFPSGTPNLNDSIKAARSSHQCSDADCGIVICSPCG